MFRADHIALPLVGKANQQVHMHHLSREEAVFISQARPVIQSDRSVLIHQDIYLCVGNRLRLART